MIEYTTRRGALVLSEDTSRACGHTAEIDGETPDGRDSARARSEVFAVAESMAQARGRAVEVYATCGSHEWMVDEVQS